MRYNINNLFKGFEKEKNYFNDSKLKLLIYLLIIAWKYMPIVYNCFDNIFKKNINKNSSNSIVHWHTRTHARKIILLIGLLQPNIMYDFSDKNKRIMSFDNGFRQNIILLICHWKKRRWIYIVWNVFTDITLL